MPSKQQAAAKPDPSPGPFATADGEPMSFFLRPGPVKRKIQPLIASGGGTLCGVQQPGAILLIDPEERGSIPQSTAQRYVSTQYIYDCIEKGEQLNIEDYRLHPEMVLRQSTRLNNSKEGSARVLGGRVAYTPEDDAAILSYVGKHKAEIGGNRLWQEMEKQRVTGHSWQSMKYRYRLQLVKKQSEVKEVKAKEEATKEEGHQETDVHKPASEDAAPLQTHSAETDHAQVLQVDAEPTPPESTQAEHVEAETSNSPQPGGPCLDPQADAHPIPAESTEPETAEPQATTSPQKESEPEDSLQALPDIFTPKQPKEKQKASPKQEQPRRRSTRRQLELEASSSPEPYGKKLRSSSTSPEKLSSSPQPAKKTKSADQPAVENHTTTDPPPSKKAREESVAAVAETQQEESEEAAVSEAPPTGSSADKEEWTSPPQRGEKKKKKKKEKRKLGILELATKEFEDESESSEDEAADLQNPTEIEAVQPTSTQPPPPPSDAAADPAPTQSNPEPGPEEETQQTQDLGSNRAPETGCPKPAASDPAAAAAAAASTAHLFIFDSESQEDDSQSLISDSSAARTKTQPLANKDAAPSLTQVQLEEDVQQIRELMNQTKQDLFSVTKALLKTSGDLSAALDLLLNPSSISGPFWNRHDDGLLLSADPVVRQQLQEKYGEEGVAKRILFLEVEG